MRKKIKKGELAFDITNILVLTVVGIICLYPFLYVVMASLCAILSFSGNRKDSVWKLINMYFPMKLQPVT